MQDAQKESFLLSTFMASWSGESQEPGRKPNTNPETGKEQGKVSPASGKAELSGASSPLTEKGRPQRILIVDDEQLIADTLVRILNINGFLATAVYSGESALEALNGFCPDIVLTDVRMPGRNGIETGILIRKQCPETRVVLFSGQAGVSDLMQQARRDGHGFELWPKPLHPKELVRRLRE